MKTVLIQAVHDDLRILHQSLADPSENDTKTSISKTFLRIDREILENLSNSSTAKHVDRDIAAQGSCALLCFYSAYTNKIFTACTGDSRAVYGRRLGSNKVRWLANALSIDQNLSSNTDEVRRLESEHSGENVIQQNRLMGDLAVSRAFGDARFKISLSNPSSGTQLTRVKSYERDMELQTPPYVTAEPVVTVHYNIKKGDFLILGTDGLWDFLSNEDAVALVGRWTDRGLNDNGGTTMQETRLTDSQEESFVFKDDNAAVHLIRNALGGVRKGRLEFNLSLPLGKDAAKRYRDDITAMVIFFEINNRKSDSKS